MNKDNEPSKPAEPIVQNPVNPVRAPVPESKEVREAREAGDRRARYDQLTEAAKIFGVDLGNSGDQIAGLIEQIRDGTAGERALASALELFHERLERASEHLVNHKLV